MKKQLIEIEKVPFNAETPLGSLAQRLTPSGLFYVRNHFDQPHLDAAHWHLLVDGLVQTPYRPSLEEIQRLPHRSVVLTMECAGNGRSMMTPIASGTQWGLGAVSTAKFTGTPLQSLLDEVKVSPQAIELVFTGADRGSVDSRGIVPFARSLPVAVARDPDTLLAWDMNDEPLLPQHGFPLRLVVPRWYGVASVKWLSSIHASATRFDGYFQRERYIYLKEHGTLHGEPVTSMRVRSLITNPADGDEMRGKVSVQGIAWSGSGPIQHVEVSVNDGESWREAELLPPPSAFAATPWRRSWYPKRDGAHSIMARATDSRGNSQPLESRWNSLGYGNNLVHRIRVTVNR
jgi:DMSO/TMAO reductase YedYZ molybdopterin-dependent catalytic subunit